MYKRPNEKMTATFGDVVGRPKRRFIALMPMESKRCSSFLVNVHDSALFKRLGRERLSSKMSLSVGNQGLKAAGRVSRLRGEKYASKHFAVPPSQKKNCRASDQLRFFF